MRRLDLGNLLRSSRRHDSTSPFSAFGPQVDDPVGGLDNLKVVLDDQHGVAGLDKSVQNLEQQLDVGEMEPGRRLVEEIQRASGPDLHEFAGEFHTRCASPPDNVGEGCPNLT